MNPPNQQPTVCQRLELSRARLRLALADPPPRRAAADGAHGMAWADALSAMPGATLAGAAFKAWWARHPARPFATVARAVVLPLVQRHPIALAAAALLVGGLVAWSRPWRWLGHRSVLGGLLTQVATTALAALPIASWMAAWAAPPPTDPPHRPQPSQSPMAPSGAPDA